MNGNGNMPTLGKIALFAAAGFMLVVLFMPNLTQNLTRLTRPSETVIVPASSTNPGDSFTGAARELEIVTLLGFDAIQAILSPSFVSAEEAEAQMAPDELVMGVSVNGDHRAYSLRMLSRHEIVNDVVGGVPVAVTW